MSEAVVHECPDGQRFRINMIQAIRDQPLVNGVRFAFQVDSDVEEGGAAAEEGAVMTFDVDVSFAPIFVSIATPQARRHLGARAAKLITQLLDHGHRQKTDLRITSDGAAMLEGSVVGRLYRLA